MYSKIIRVLVWVDKEANLARYFRVLGPNSKEKSTNFLAQALSWSIWGLDRMIAVFESMLAVSKEMICSIRLWAGAISSPTDFQVVSVSKPLMMCLVTQTLLNDIIGLRKAPPWLQTYSKVKSDNVCNVAVPTIFTSLYIVV